LRRSAEEDVIESDNEILKAALAYAGRDWCVIPVHFPKSGQKAAGVKWKRFQDDRPTEQELQQWFAGGKYPGLAVVLGEVSGYLACRDFDKASAYEKWAERRCDLARELPTVRTHRGYHVYFTDIVEKTVAFEDGELRGAKSYCCLPPSPHPRGGHYEWIVRPNGDVPVVDPEKALLVPSMPQKQAECKPSKLKAVVLGEDAVELAIQSTLPTGPHQRNRRVFDLCRALKGIDALADPVKLKPAIRRWHERALPVITTKDFDETWLEFLYGWDRVKVPMHVNLMADALQRARENPVEDSDYENPNVRDLLALCRELQAMWTDGPFFLSCRTAARLFGVDPKKAWRWLYLIEREGWIKTHEKGGSPKNPWKATRFWYLGDDREGKE
jgi:hypothetical protein